MAPAPPPPPVPPPPPMMPLSTSTCDNNQRGLLLQSIRDGTKLRKTVTVDKSAPFIPGKTSSVTSINNISNDSSRDAVSNIGHRNQMNVNGGGPPGLGGLFAHGMPKLKPTGLSIGVSNNSLSSREFHQGKGLPSETKARGPPPQPPPASQKPSILSSASESTLASVNGTSTRPAPPVLSSKAPVGGYGKPNVAPKPPVAKEPASPNQSSLHSQINSMSGSLQTLNDTRGGSSQNLSILGQSELLSKPSPPPKKISVNGRPGVNRAQSMRAPRSPPVAPTATPPFPPNVKQNLVKNQSSLHQSQDMLNSRGFVASKTGTLPHNFIQKVNQMPPSTPPPPTPTQSQRGTPTRPPVSRPPPPPSRPPAPSAPPPPPPHRTVHAPPPPPALPTDRLASSSTSNSGPPAPPTRNSSMRNGVPSYLTEIETRFSHLFHSIQEFPEPGVYRRVVKNYNTKTSANGKKVTPGRSIKLVDNVESRKKVERNRVRLRSTTAGIAKQPAPPPPVHTQQTTTHVQLNTKMWVHNTSQC